MMTRSTVLIFALAAILGSSIAFDASVTVTIDESRQATFVHREGENLVDAARIFVQEHELADSVVAQLVAEAERVRSEQPAVDAEVLTTIPVNVDNETVQFQIYTHEVSLPEVSCTTETSDCISKLFGYSVHSHFVVDT